MAPSLVADTFVSAVAVVGLLILRRSLGGADGPDGINGRFRLVILVLVWMLGSRVFFWLFGLEFLRVVNLAAAAFIPLSMLLLCEGLMRRHSAKIFKIWTIFGATVFVVMAPFLPILSETAVGVALMTFQLISFCAIGYWVITRNRKDLSAGENTLIDRLAWSLFLIIPFAATDFRVGFIDTPVRLSGVAILVLCWLALSFNGIRTNHWPVVTSIALLFVAIATSVAAATCIVELNRTEMFQLGAVFICAALLLQIHAEARSLKTEEQRTSLLRYIIDFHGEGSAEFLRGLQAHPLVSGAVILEGADLNDFDAAFRSYVGQKQVLSAATAEHGASQDISEQLRWLFEKYSATHVLHIGDEPFQLVVVNMPSITREPGADLELSIVQRVAALMAKGRAL
jgi:hypothetical protein